MMTSLYLNYKRRHFSDEEVLDKERSLRDMMKPGREPDLIRLLTGVGFRAENIEFLLANSSSKACPYIKSSESKPSVNRL